MSAQICILASGSKGNCIYISDGNTRILIDAGISCRKIQQELQTIGVDLAQIDAVLITHEHIDHVYGLHTMQRKYSIPILANNKTSMCVDIKLNTSIAKYNKANFDTGFRIGNMEIMPFRIMHDAVCPVGYTLVVDGHKIATVTDLGVITDSVRQNVYGSELVILESNHDLQMLEQGPYTPELQARIRSQNGHLSNLQSAEFAADLARNGTKRFVLAHISESNNTPDLALKSSRFVLHKKGLDDKIEWIVAKQNVPTEVIIL